MASKDPFEFDSKAFTDHLAQELLDGLFSEQPAPSAPPSEPPRAPSAERSGTSRAERPRAARTEHSRAERPKTERSKAERPKSERPKSERSKAERPETGRRERTSGRAQEERRPRRQREAPVPDAAEPEIFSERTAQRREQRRQERLRREKQQRLILLGGIVLVLLLLIVFTVRGCSHSGKDAPLESTELVVTTVSPTPEVDRVATLAVVGDIMTHDSQLSDAYDADTDTYDFTYCLSNIADLLQSADFTMGNLETVMNGGTPTGYPLFNSPDALATSLKTLGFDLLTTANNHCLDQGFDGLTRTLEVLDETGIDHVGTYRSQEEYDSSQGVLLEDINGISVAFLDYTYAVNGMLVEHDYAVNIFNSDYESTQSTLDEDKLSAELSYAKSLNPDIIIACLHWGIEYQTVESSYQDEIADYLIANGVSIILGGHPHVCQPMEYRTATDSSGVEHSGFVCYSLGNFISGQTLAICGPYVQDTAILNLELTKDGATGVTTLSDVSYTPLYFLNQGSSAEVQYRMYNVLDAISDYDNGNPDEFVDETVYATLTQARDDLATILGESWKATSGGF